MADTPLLPLDKLDPVQSWQPWQPDDKQPWNLKWAGHLYRRAAFGAPLDKLREAVQRGLESTLNGLLKCDLDDPVYKGFEAGIIIAVGEKHTRQNKPTELRGWWLYCIYYSPQPLREKMTLFWHNHFATSIVKVQSVPMMFEQNKLIRRHALGKFGPFLQEMSKDPAMLVWLDSNSNVKGKPNENYARELMELFSLGVGNYSEKDIQEAARAFTGWHTNGERFEFVADQHDDGEKTVLGKTGNFNGDDIVRICLEQKVCPYFLTRKLYRFFISEAAVPPDSFLEPLAEQFRKSDYDIAGLVGTMLRSRHFFSAYAYRQRIKSPVEFVMGAVNEVGQGLVTPRALIGKVDDLGQPNVKGWEDGRAWLNTAVVLMRHNFCQLLTVNSGQLNLGDPRTGVGPAVDPAALIRRANLTDPEQILSLIIDVLLQGDLHEAARAKLLAFLKEGNPTGNALDQRVRETFHAIMTMPEYQLA